MAAQPIETAPKTGERILLWGDLRIAGYELDSEQWDPEWNIGYWADEMWVDGDVGEIILPTHWTPLPPKP